MEPSLEQRILLILREKKWSQRALAKSARLSPNYVSSLLTRLRQDPTVTMDTPAVLGIAAAAGVSQEWLTTGQGEPWPTAPASDDDSLDPLRARRGWKKALDEAKGNPSPGVPEALYEEAGKLVIPGRALDAQLVRKAAELLLLTNASSRFPESEPAPASASTTRTPPRSASRLARKRPTG